MIEPVYQQKIMLSQIKMIIKDTPNMDLDILANKMIQIISINIHINIQHLKYLYHD